MEQTLVIIKPDAMQRGLAGEIIARLERRGLRIAAMKLIWMDEALARRHYAEHEGKAFLLGLLNFITSSPVIVAVFEGKGAIEAVRQTMGATDPLVAAPGSIRGDLALDMLHNLIHGSDSLESARKEISLFFDEEELLSYRRDVEGGVVEEGSKD